ncbi:MAG: signal recognition particle protein [Lachnospiraceae bacterium]|jgi:signal recognition particle subunit SRP54|nr:signal recognition particle protein [Lachnospiraceae bacterium]
MAFENLSDKLQGVFKKLRGKGVLTEKDLKEALREVKLALLEADVNFKVVKEFINKIQERAIGQDVMKSLTPGQQVVKIVNEEMIALMGSDEESALQYGSVSPTVMMMVGLQGAGKTTLAAKLAKMLKNRGKKPMLAACDVYRPAAIKQLQVLGEQIDVPVFEMGTETSPVLIAQKAIEKARDMGCNLVLLDTAGRLQIDEALMEELQTIKNTVNPSEILLVVDAMTGQEAVNVAKGFDEQLSITGVALTKLDGDTRGGAALSIRAVTGKPIKFSGVGEKLDDIEPFHSERMASRILGMGDVLTMIEKAQEAIDEEQAKELTQRVMSKDFNLEDFLTSMQQVKKMGSMSSLLGMLPGIGSKLKDVDIDESAIGRVEALIYSMTPEERRKPQILNASRKRRIVKGSGTTIQELNRLLKQFEQSKAMMKQFSGKKGKRRGLLSGLGGKNPFGF